MQLHLVIMVVLRNTLDVQDANGNPNGFFSGATLWEADTSIYARINQEGPELGSHWDMLHQSPFSIGIAAEADNIYWLFDGFHNTIVKYDFKNLTLIMSMAERITLMALFTVMTKLMFLESRVYQVTWL